MLIKSVSVESNTQNFDCFIIRITENLHRIIIGKSYYHQKNLISPRSNLYRFLFRGYKTRIQFHIVVQEMLIIYCL